MSKAKNSAAHLWKYALSIKWHLFFGMLLMPLSVYFTLRAPLAVGVIINELIKEGIGIVNESLFWQQMAIFIGCTIGKAVFSYISTIILNVGANRVILYVQNDIFRLVQKLPVSYFDSMPAGKISSRVSNDPRMIRMLFQVVLSRFVMAGVSIIGIAIAIYRLEKGLLLFFIPPMPIIYWLIKDFRRKSGKAVSELRKSIADISSMFNETIQSMSVIRAFNNQADREAEYEAYDKKAYDNDTIMTELFAYSSFNAIATLRVLMCTIILVYFGLGKINGSATVSIGLLYVFIDYVIRFFDSVQSCFQNLSSLERAVGAANHVFELLNAEKEYDESDKKCDGINLSGDVVFDNVRFSYVEGEEVLKGVSFKVKRGETVGIVGRTGSGKTSLMNLLFRFYNPTSGTISVGGVDTVSVPVEAVRKNMSIVIQDPFLFMGTIESNVSLGKKDIGEREVENALVKVGAQKLLSSLTDGIKTVVSEQGMTYSLGERQLISFARALVADPEILVLDEATANIDSETENIIQNGIAALKEGRTTFIIAHRLSTIMNADMIIVLDKGMIVESGKHDELVAMNGIYAELWRKSQRVD